MAGGSYLKYSNQGRLQVVTFHQKPKLHGEARTEHSRLREL